MRRKGIIRVQLTATTIDGSEVLKVDWRGRWGNPAAWRAIRRAAVLEGSERVLSVPVKPSKRGRRR